MKTTTRNSSLHADQAYSSMRTAEVEAELATSRLQAGRAALDHTKTAADAGDRRGSWLKILIWTPCAAACFAAEFVLCWNGLCFVLNTVLGMLLGLAPPSGLAVQEVVIARLFEDPWQELRRSVASTRRTVVRVAMAVLLAALAAGNGITIWHLAKAREVAFQLESVLNWNLTLDATEKELTSLYRTTIDRAVMWVSLLVSIDGATFLRLSLGRFITAGLPTGSLPQRAPNTHDWKPRRRRLLPQWMPFMRVGEPSRRRPGGRRTVPGVLPVLARESGSGSFHGTDLWSKRCLTCCG